MTNNTPEVARHLTTSTAEADIVRILDHVDDTAYLDAIVRRGSVGGLPVGAMR